MILYNIICNTISKDFFELSDCRERIILLFQWLIDCFTFLYDINLKLLAYTIYYKLAVWAISFPFITYLTAKTLSNLTTQFPLQLNYAIPPSITTFEKCKLIIKTSTITFSNNRFFKKWITITLSKIISLWKREMNLTKTLCHHREITITLTIITS